MCDQHFKQIDTRVKFSIKCKNSVSNPKELATSLEGLPGLLFQVLVIDRNIQPVNPESISDLHYISYLKFVYKEDECTGVKFLEQSFNVDHYCGTFKSKEDLNKLWKNNISLDSTLSSSYDPLTTTQDKIFEFMHPVTPQDLPSIIPQDLSITPQDLPSIILQDLSITPQDPLQTQIQVVTNNTDSIKKKPFKSFMKIGKHRKKIRNLNLRNRSHQKKIPKQIYLSQAHRCQFCNRPFILKDNWKFILKIVLWNRKRKMK